MNLNIDPKIIAVDNPLQWEWYRKVLLGAMVVLTMFIALFTVGTDICALNAYYDWTIASTFNSHVSWIAYGAWNILPILNFVLVAVPILFIFGLWTSIIGAVIFGISAIYNGALAVTGLVFLNWSPTISISFVMMIVLDIFSALVAIVLIFLAVAMIITRNQILGKIKGLVEKKL